MTYAPKSTTTQNIHLARLMDRLAQWLISAAGIVVIAAVLGIIVLLIQVVRPLLATPPAILKWQILRANEPQTDPASPIMSVVMGEFSETFALIYRDGRAVFYQAPGLTAAPTQDPSLLSSMNVIKISQLQDLVGASPQDVLRDCKRQNSHEYTLTWDSGSVSLIKFKFEPTWNSDGTRTIVPSAKKLIHLEQDQDIKTAQARRLAGGDEVVVSRTPHEVLYERRVAQSSGMFGSATFETFRQSIATYPSLDTPELMALSEHGDKLAIVTYPSATTRQLEIWQWDPATQKLTANELSPKNTFDVTSLTAMSFLFGGNTLVVGNQLGQMFALHQIADVEQEHSRRQHWRTYHEFEPIGSEVVAIAASVRDKSFVSLSRLGVLQIDYLTNERRLYTIQDDARIVAFDYGIRNNTLLSLNSNGTLNTWSLENQHPEVSFNSYTNKVWYESYPSPAHVWQSTGGGDEFEPKLSLIPLIFGTLKATFYSLFFALPLSILGAIYLSQFAGKRVRAFAKPIIEMMASLPSVVIGFFAAFWLAPFLGRNLLGFVLFITITPIALLGFLYLWPRLQQKLAQHNRSQFANHREYWIMLPVVGLSALVCSFLAEPLEIHFFAGSLTQWLFNHHDIRYDLRNGIVIAVALGFAVIPIILSLSDDSLTSVPSSLTAASLALGSSRWQTVWRIVVPSASPGIFAATMIGIGRAIGETMIVLMAAGNTPIMDASPFNGMRTLSANIAVEIAEAPFGGTLYRTLFLCAVILFLFTFTLNTAAELVRTRLRKSYGKF